jgi:hypothetical protein
MLRPNLKTNKVLSWIARDWTYGVFLQYKSGLPMLAPTTNNNLASYLFQSTFADGRPVWNIGRLLWRLSQAAASLGEYEFGPDLADQGAGKF